MAGEWEAPGTQTNIGLDILSCIYLANENVYENVLDRNDLDIEGS